MSMSSSQQKKFAYVIAGTLNMVPGGNTAAFANYFQSVGYSVSSFVSGLTTTDIFKDVYNPAWTSTQFAQVFVENLLGGTVSDTAKASAVNYIARYAEMRGQDYAITKALTKLYSYSPTHSRFGEAKKAFDNKADVVIYSIEENLQDDDVSALRAILADVTNDPESVTDAKAKVDADLPDPDVGQTFTLTTGLDVINGTAGNDTIIGEFGANNTLNAGDQIDGRGGIDTLKMYGNFDAAQMPANIKNIQIAHLNATNDADHNFSNWTKAATGIEKWEIANASLLSGRTITTTDNQSLSLATGPGNVATAGAVTWAASANDTTASLILNGYQGGKGVNPGALTITGAATQTIDLNLMSAKSQISTFTLPDTATKMVITGDQSFVVKANTVGANLAEIDASATTGGVNLAVNGTNANLKFTGGDGNDTVIFGATNTFAETNVLDGKGGSNTLGMRKNEAVNVNSDTKIYGNISNFDTLKITTATIDGEFIDLKAFGVKNITFDAAATATTTVRNLNDGAKVSIGAASTAVLNLENVTANDTLNLMTTGAAVTYALTANNFQTINVNTGSATGASTINFTNPQLKTLNLTNQKSDGTYNDHAVVFTTELGVITELVDLTGFKAATAGNGVTVNLNNTAVNGATVKGSDNNDTIQGSNQADTIIAGKGDDEITGRGGNDTIDISAGGQNTVTFSAANVNGLDSITGFQTGTLAGRDVLHIGALGVGQSATLTLVANLTSAAAIGDDSINIVNYAADIAGKNFGGGQFADFFGAGKVLAATMSANQDALVVVQGTDQTHIYAIKNDGTPAIIADEVTLVGILTNTTNAATFHADNFAHV